MAREKVSQNTINVARASYERCCELPDFFDAFYRHLFDSRPQVESMFRNTDFERQHRLLRHAIGLLLDFPSIPQGEHPNILTRLADLHGRRQIDIDPGLYLDWVDSLILTVREHDPECDAEIERAWRRAVRPGVEYMKSRADPN